MNCLKKNGSISLAVSKLFRIFRPNFKTKVYDIKK